MSPITLAVHMLVSLVRGALIGTERQWRQRMAGLRTNTLIESLQRWRVGALTLVLLIVIATEHRGPTTSTAASARAAFSPGHT